MPKARPPNSPPMAIPGISSTSRPSAFAVPRWEGTRPYQQLPFQFSLHIIHGDGAHGASGLPRSIRCRSLTGLRRGTHPALRHQGPIFAYNAGFESRVIGELAARFPDSRPHLHAIAARLVDLLPIARRHYYHPSQHGSWSIKAVLPALCPDLSYADLDGVQDGNMAQTAYQEAIARRPPPNARRSSSQQLHEYCKLDTLAMVRIWQVFKGN
jgi:hypothetical protein